MTAHDRSRRSEGVFAELIGLDGARRESRLLELCGPDAGLEAEVRSLLSFHDRSGGMLETRGFPAAGELLAGLAPPGSRALAAEGPAPARVGPYTLKDVLGEGGMGVVYLAEQDRPRRTVAMKLIRRGWSTASLVRRFEHEAELLGRLHHPGIAQIFEAGVAETPTGAQPYIAMELVRGPNLVRYVQERGVPTRGRLALMAKVCDAVGHAHQRGVIHRDLKPANILVDESTGEPKVVDFGVARASGAGYSATTMGTTPGQLVGTLAYMSPEQVGGAPEEVDTRADVYALGVILYEALSGRTPLDLRDRPILEGVRMIRESEPTRLSGVSGVFRGEVETIVQKAMAKDASRRYQSAAELAGDLRRYLAGEPILAKQDSAMYMLRTQLRRYRRLVGVGLLFAAGVSGFAIYAGVQAERQRELAAGEGVAKREALDARDTAVKATARAMAESERLRRSLYLTNIGHAQAAMLTGDIERSRALLSACPSDLRGWEWRYLVRQSDQARSATPIEPAARLVTADRRLERALARSDAGVYSVVDGERGCTLHAVTMLTDWRNAIFSHDGRCLVYPMSPGSLVWHDIESDRVVRQVEAPPTSWPVAVSDDGRVVLVRGPGPGVVFALEASTGSALAALEVGDAVVADFSDDGGLAALGSDRGNVAVYDTSTWMARWERTLHDGWVRDIEVSRDGALVASAGHDGSVRVWSALDGGSVAFPIHDNKVVSVSFSPDGQRLLSGSSDRLVKLTDLSSSRVVRAMRGHTNSVTRPVFDGSGEVRSLGADGVIRRWGPAGERDDATIATPTPIFAGRVLPGSGVLVVGASNATLDLYDARTLSRTRSVEIGERRFAVRTLDATRDGGLLAAALTDGTLRLVRVSDWSVVRTLDQGSRRLVAGAIAPDGSWAAAGDSQGMVRVWDARDGAEVASFRAGRGAINAMAASADGARLAIGAQDGGVLVVGARTGEVLHALAGFSGRCLGVAFSPDGASVAACGERGQVLVWNLASPDAVRRCEGHLDDVYAVAFSPDGARLASAGWDNLVRLWDPARGEGVLSLRGHIGVVQFAAFSPDGARLVTGDSLRMLTTWETASRR
ncbi:MAG: protein kinase [Phycisphaerae bacterium]|nr:protein kinase [Phycisphaerae bacterium]